MRRFIVIVIVLMMLTGCSSSDVAQDRAMLLRKNVLEKDCTFDAVMTADYGDVIFEFRMACSADKDGNMNFTVLQPESISGITGNFTASGGKLTFDDEVLAFEMLADGQLSPVSAPWMMIRTLQSGYMDAYGVDEEGLRLQIYDSYRDEALQLDIWTNRNDIPVRAEIVYSGRRILSIDVENFVFM